MSYSTVSHVGHESFPHATGGFPGPGLGPAPPPPPRPGFDQDYYGPGYQSYFSDNYPPQAGQMHYNDSNRPFHHHQPHDHHSNDHHHHRHNGLLSLLKASLAAVCCCWVLEQCCCCNCW